MTIIDDPTNPSAPGKTNQCIKQVTLIDVQGTDCPEDVRREVIKLWRSYRYGNDNYVHKWSWINEQDCYPVIAQYLKSNRIDDCLIHWWW